MVIVQKQIADPLELTVVENWKTDRPDDFFICWGSPELRCTGSVNKLHSGYKADHVFILKYSNHESKRRTKNIKSMIDRLELVGNTSIIPIDESKPMPILKEIVENIESLLENKKDARITIDISTSIKWHLLILLKFLNSRNLLSNIRLLYTEPEQYITSLFQSLSFGIKEIFPIPLYYGNYDFSKNDLLVLILGYEGSRAMALYADLDPAECILLIADPPYKKEWKGRSEELNKEIINIIGKSKIKYIDSRNPLKVELQLRKILTSSKYKSYNHIISPLGTKPQTIGLFLYLLKALSNSILIYGSPLRHNNLFYSKGIGRTWELPFKRRNK